MENLPDVMVVKPIYSQAIFCIPNFPGTISFDRRFDILLVIRHCELLAVPRPNTRVPCVASFILVDNAEGGGVLKRISHAVFQQRRLRDKK